jgi:hypothetical protein
MDDLAMDSTPLSKDLEELLREQQGHGSLTLNQVIQHTDGRGLFLLMILFCLPFFTPVPLPGVSNVLGAVMCILGIRLAFGRPPRLPRFIGEREFQPQRMAKVLRVTVRVVRFLEKFIRPRRTAWLHHRAARSGNALLIAFMAVLLALPLPPVIPFSNSFPSWAILLLAASMMEEDGVMIWVAYAACVGTVVYFITIANVLVSFFERHYEQIKTWLLSWL